MYVETGKKVLLSMLKISKSYEQPNMHPSEHFLLWVELSDDITRGVDQLCCIARV